MTLSKQEHVRAGLYHLEEAVLIFLRDETPEGEFVGPTEIARQVGLQQHFPNVSYTAADFISYVAQRLHGANRVEYGGHSGYRLPSNAP